MNLPDYLILLVVSLIGIFLIYKTLFNVEKNFTPFNWFFTFSIFYICTGALFTIVFSQSSIKELLFSNYEIKPMGIFYTVLILMLFNLILYIILKAAKKFDINWYKYWQETSYNIKINPLEYYVVLVICLLVQILAVYSGDLGFEGVQLDFTSVSIGHASPLGLISNWISVALPAYCVFLIFNTRKFKFLIILVFIWTVLITFVIGRRVMISSCALSIIPFFIYYTNTKKRIGVIIAISIFAFLGSIGFYFLRVANWQLFADNERKSLTSIVELATDMIQGKESNVSQGVKSDALNNITSRTFNIGYVNLVRQYAYKNSGANGEILYYSVLGILPGFIFPEKHEFTWRGGEEGITNEYLGLLSAKDENNSIITAALADFGYIGILIYSLVFGFLIIISCIMFRISKGSAWTLLAILHFFWTLSYFETQFVGYFIAFRFQVFLCILGVASSFFYRKIRIRTHHHRITPSHPFPTPPRG